MLMYLSCSGFKKNSLLIRYAPDVTMISPTFISESISTRYLFSSPISAIPAADDFHFYACELADQSANSFPSVIVQF